jgi:hypothetical protein
VNSNLITIPGSGNTNNVTTGAVTPAEITTGNITDTTGLDTGPVIPTDTITGGTGSTTIDTGSTTGAVTPTDLVNNDFVNQANNTNVDSLVNDFQTKLDQINSNPTVDTALAFIPAIAAALDVIGHGAVAYLLSLLNPTAGTTKADATDPSKVAIATFINDPNNASINNLPQADQDALRIAAAALTTNTDPNNIPEIVVTAKRDRDTNVVTDTGPVVIGSGGTPTTTIGGENTGGGGDTGATGPVVGATGTVGASSAVVAQ